MKSSARPISLRQMGKKAQTSARSQRGTPSVATGTIARFTCSMWKQAKRRTLRSRRSSSCSTNAMFSSRTFSMSPNSVSPGRSRLSRPYSVSRAPFHTDAAVTTTGTSTPPVRRGVKSTCNQRRVALFVVRDVMSFEQPPRQLGHWAHTGGDNDVTRRFESVCELGASSGMRVSGTLRLTTAWQS